MKRPIASPTGSIWSNPPSTSHAFQAISFGVAVQLLRGPQHYLRRATQETSSFQETEIFIW